MKRRSCDLSGCLTGQISKTCPSDLTHQNRYNEKVVEYSANGMIKRFQRRGLKSDGIYGKIDNLHISLDGNRPISIVEDAGNQTVYGAMEFQSHSTSGTQYGYDDNGSLIWDANKQIAHITYDNLNYPKEVQFTNGNRIQYIYSPDGQKLRATWQTAVANIVVPLNPTVNLSSSQISSTTRTDYIGNVIYTGTASSSSASVKLSKYLFEGGYATVTPTTQPVFHYFTQDHLGNNRAVVSQSGTVEQITHYYPFGGFFADQGTNSSLQPYKYNGKELDRMHGLDLYDYGARQYDPIVPMFTQQDPMAEKYYHLSPYAYCANNPVNAIDIDGEKVQLVVRQLNPFIPISIAAHTFLIVSHEGKHPISYTYGPHGAIGGKLERTSYNYDNEIREGKKTEVDYQIIDVPIPENLSEEEFDSNIHEAAKQFDGNTEVNYNILTFSDRTANCNTSTTTLLYKAGVSKETIKELKNEIKGNAYGFGQTRPWTREERQKLEEDIDNSNKFLGL